MADKPHIRAEVRQGVMEAVKEVGYSPSRVACCLRVSHTNSIGMVIADMENPFLVQLVKTIEENVFDWQYNIYFSKSDENPEKETAIIRKPFWQKMLQL